MKYVVHELRELYELSELGELHELGELASSDGTRTEWGEPGGVLII